MGMGMVYFEYLSERGHLAKNSRILDIGSQNLYNATLENIRSFVEKYGAIDDEDAFQEAATKIAYHSTPRTGERTSYISELLDLTEIFYTSYDVCPGLKTEIFDLNHEQLPERNIGGFDVVLNFGTTEHVFNQLNSYQVMHDALKVGGIIFHQLPSIGWTDHGYFCYHSAFFDDLAKANDYEIVDRWYAAAGISQPRSDAVETRDQTTPLESDDRDGSRLPETLVNYNIHAVLRKTRDTPFRVGLELATSHAALSGQTNTLYGPGQRLVISDASTLEALRRIVGISIKENVDQAVPESVNRAVSESLDRTVSKSVNEASAAVAASIIPNSVDLAVSRAIAQGAISRAIDEAAARAVAQAVQDVIPNAVADAAIRAVEQSARDVVPLAVTTAVQNAVAAELGRAHLLADSRFLAVYQTRTVELAREVLRRLKSKLGL